MFKYYTIQNPPPSLPEPESKLDDLCRQSDFVPLPTLLERFLVSGAQYTRYMQAQALSAEDKERLFEVDDVSDLADMDLVEQKEFIDNAMANMSAIQKEAEKKPTQTKSEPEQAHKEVTSAEEAK